MSNKIIIINGPNLNLLGEREQSQYGSITFEDLKKNCLNKAKEIGINLEFTQSNIEGEIVTLIQDSRKKFDGLIINAAGFTHTSVAISLIRDLCLNSSLLYIFDICNSIIGFLNRSRASLIATEV